MVRDSEHPEHPEDDIDTVVVNQKHVVNSRQKHRRMHLMEAGQEVLYNGAHLEIESCFGISQRAFKRNIVFQDEEEDTGGTAKMTLAYMCSERLVTYNLLTQKQAFLPFEARGMITFLETVRKREGLVYVIAERFFNESPTLVLYTPEKKPIVFPHSHLKPNSYLRQVKLPKDAQPSRSVCVTLSSFPHVISVWKIDKQKLLTEKELKVQQPAFDQNPDNPLQIVIAGVKYLRIWEINSQEKRIDETNVHLVHLKVERDTDFIDIKYVPGTRTLLSLSADNKVFIFENHEQIRVVSDVFSPGSQGLLNPAQDQYIAVINKQLGQVTAETAQAECLAVSRRGFFVGGTGGFLSIFFFEDSRPPLHISTTQLSSLVSHTKSISVSSDDQTLACVCQKIVDTTEIESKSSREAEEEMPEIKLEYYLANLKKVESELPDAVWPLFPASQHFGAIRDVSMSVGRNQVVTVGDDSYLRVWHYTSEWKGVTEHKFPEHPLTVGMHPQGFQIAVGFKDSFKVFFVLDEDLFPVVDQSVKMCYGLAYSPGGRYLAANNSGTVFVLSTYTLSIVATYASHSAPVHSIAWNSTEALLTSACFGGSVSVWDLVKCEVRGPSPSRQGKLMAAFYDEEYDMYIVLTNDGIARLHGENCSRMSVLPTLNFTYTSMLLVKEIGLVFLGTSVGILRVSLWPMMPTMEGEQETFDFQDIRIHSSSISRIEVSIPHEQIVTVSADGSVFLQSIRVLYFGTKLQLSKAILREKNTHQSLMQYTTPDTKIFSQLALVKRDKLDILNTRIKDLEDGISTLKSQHKYKIETMEHEAKEDLDKQQLDYEDKLRFEMEYISKLKKDMDAREGEYKLSIASLKAQHEQEMEDMTRKHDQARSDEQDRYDALKDEIEELKQVYAKEVEALINMHKEVKANIERDCQEKVNQVNTAYKTLWETMKQQSNEYEMGLQMSEKEYEEELTKEKEKLAKALEKMQEQVMILNKEKKELTGEKDKLSKDEEERTKVINELEEMNRLMRTENEELKNKLVKMQEQLVEREEVIKKKENTIKELRSFNIHLQNFRFVLDQKIKSLKDDRGPMSEQMTNLQSHIRNMYSELLEEFGHTKTTMKSAAELKAKNHSLSQLNSQLRSEIVLAKRKVSLIQSDLVQLVRVTNKDTLLFGLKQLIDKHLSMEELVKGGAEAELAKADTMSVEEANLAKVKQEIMYQHDLMKEQLMAIQRKTKTLETKSTNEVQRKMQENAALIKECNMLRNDISRLQKENSMLRDRSKAVRSQGNPTGEMNLPKVVHLKETPYQQLKKVGSAVDLRSGDRSAQRDKLLPPATPSRPELRIKTLISELEKNQHEIIEQNTQFKKLQEQVSTFLYQPDSIRPPMDSESEQSSSSPFRLREVSPLPSSKPTISHSATQPLLGTTTDTFSVKPEGSTLNVP